MMVPRLWHLLYSHEEQVLSNHAELALLLGHQAKYVVWSMGRQQ
jgi:hypothetical protein